MGDAFKDVASALEDKDRIVNEAVGDQSEAIHRARGTAQKTISEALGYKEGKVNRAKGDTARFLSSTNTANPVAATSRSLVSISRQWKKCSRVRAST